MAVTLNVRHLEDQDLDLAGDADPQELELVEVDELVHIVGPIHYELTAQKMDDSILVRGKLSVPMECECARCLKRFSQPLEISDWSLLLPLEGEDAVPVVDDSVDLTPYIREDTLLGFPQRPLCEPECRGLRELSSEGAAPSEEPGRAPSVWDELDKLKLKE
jgi:uncharacterized protein